MAPLFSVYMRICVCMCVYVCVCAYKVMRRLTTGIRSEKCVVRRFRRSANVIVCTYTNVDNKAYCTPRLYGIVYCC